MIFLALFSFILLSPIIDSTCPSLKTCLHKGTFNNSTCSCECYPAYKGEFCEFGNCAMEPENCLTDFGISLCRDASIANFCPSMCQQPICKCGFDSCLNGGQFVPSLCSCLCTAQFKGNRCETSLVTTTTTTSLQITCAPNLSCLNGGKLNNKTCSCDCNPSYSGNLCEILLCDQPDPGTCRDFQLIDCLKIAVFYYCPKMCRYCQTSTITSSTTIISISTTTTLTNNCFQQLPCLNGAKQDPLTCRCSCKL
jgi:hypothetical protein